MERDFKGIWIPKEIWLSKELSITEKAFLAEIDSLDNEDGCFAGNDYFSEFFGLSKSRCTEIIKSLEGKGFLEISYTFLNNSKVLKMRKIKVTNKVLFDRIRKTKSTVREIELPVRDSELHGSENASYNNTINNNTNINNINKKKKETDFDIIINQYTANENLKNNLYEFIKMRKGIKAAVTSEGLKRIMSKLDKLAANDSEKIQILDNSIANSWRGVFELKGGAKQEYGSTKQDNKPTTSKTIQGEGEELARRAIEKYGDKLDDFQCEY